MVWIDRYYPVLALIVALSSIAIRLYWSNRSLRRQQSEMERVVRLVFDQLLSAIQESGDESGRRIAALERSLPRSIQRLLSSREPLRDDVEDAGKSLRRSPRQERVEKTLEEAYGINIHNLKPPGRL